MKQLLVFSNSGMQFLSKKINKCQNKQFNSLRCSVLLFETSFQVYQCLKNKNLHAIESWCKEIAHPGSRFHISIAQNVPNTVSK